MEEVIPWAQLLAVLEPFYPKGGRGRPPLGLERMLRVYFLQQWHGLADEALADALYARQALQGFARLDLAGGGVPDATTLLNFRHLLETHDLCQGLFAALNAALTARGLLLRAGTLVDATLIAAPPSTRNKAKQRDPERPQTKQGNPWCFGMKAHLGADRDSQLVHPVVVTAANVALGRAIDWQIACQRSLIKALAEGAEQAKLKAVEKAKAAVRAFVEHPFHFVKNLFSRIHVVEIKFS